jgi:hypothetical protein
VIGLASMVVDSFVTYRYALFEKVPIGCLDYYVIRAPAFLTFRGVGGSLYT